MSKYFARRRAPRPSGRTAIDVPELMIATSGGSVSGEPGGASTPHVAIVMDGNGRWAERRGLLRSAGHRAGAYAVRRAVSSALQNGVGTLTLYAFSADNWKRPPTEVKHLMRLFEAHLRSEVPRCRERGIRVSVIGRRDRLPAGLLDAVQRTEEATRGGGALHLRLAVDYSARTAIAAACGILSGPEVTPADFEDALARATHAPAGTPPVDLLIRTGGEQRLSDFLLWESAYAELVFLRAPWPEFDGPALAGALDTFRSRDRRFGGLSSAPSPPVSVSRRPSGYHPFRRG